MHDNDQVDRRVAFDRPFRYEIMWETHPDYMTMLEKLWKDDMHSCSVQELQAKLNRLSSKLASWGVCTFGHVRKELRELKGRLLQLWSEASRT
jgi:hypothetical protein